MANLVLTNAKWYVDQYDLSGDVTSHSNPFTVDAVENTTFGTGGARTYLAGLRNATHTVSGYVDFNLDNFDALSTNEALIVTVTPAGDAIGSAAILYQSVRSSFTAMTGAVGEMAGLELSGQVTGPAVSGVMLAESSARPNTGTTTGVQHGVVSATQSTYAALHMFSVTAATVTVLVESDTANTFATPTTRHTFTALSIPGTQWSAVAGATADSWWRTSFTVTGDTCVFAVSFGIQ